MKKVLSIALAYVGVLVGAGFASGQEMIQYFVSNGSKGLWGVAVAGLLFILTGRIILSLGSYFLADSHSDVMDSIAGAWLSRAMDLAFLLTCFFIGFVMIAGAGTNLHQQFGIPVWIGSLGMTLLIGAVGMLDTDKVVKVIGAITPFLVVTVLVVAVFSIFTADLTFSQAEQLSRKMSPGISNFILSAFNYLGMCLMTGCSMAFVMGGDEVNTRAAGRGGLLGGALVAGLLGLSAVSMFLQLDHIAGSAMPMLALGNRIHPAFGIFMSLVILGMIFNTGMGMYYSIASRLTVKKPENFSKALFVLLAVGFALSFVGFETLVEKLYPVIGYVGLVLVALLLFAWLKNKGRIRQEAGRRRVLGFLFRRKYDKNLQYKESHRKTIRHLLENSPMDNEELWEEIDKEAQDKAEEWNQKDYETTREEKHQIYAELEDRVEEIQDPHLKKTVLEHSDRLSNEDK